MWPSEFEKNDREENLSFFFDPLSKIFNPIERARGKKPARELVGAYIRWMEKDDGVDFVWVFRRQCGDEADPCSEAENFSVEETTLTTSATTTAGTTTSTRKVTRSRSNEIIPPPFRRIFKIVFEIEERYGSTSNRDKLLLSASFSCFIFSSFSKDKNESNLNISVFLIWLTNFIFLIV